MRHLPLHRPNPPARRSMRRFVCGLAAALAGFACAAQELTVAVSRTSLSLPFYVAESQKYFADEGVAVKRLDCIGGPRCLKLMLDGQVPLATAAEMSVMFSSFDRADYAIIATFVTSANDLKLLTRKSSGITSVAQLAGKRIGTVKGTGAHYFLDAALVFNGLDPQRTELVMLAPEQIGPALKDGRIDAASIWEPFAHQSMRELAADGAVIPGPRLYTLSFNLVADRKLIAERNADIVKLLRALVRAERFIRERPLQAQAMLKETLDVDQAYVDATWSDYEYRMSLDQSLVSTLEGQARWAVREGHVPQRSRIPNYLRFVDREALRKAAPDAVTLVK